MKARPGQVVIYLALALAALAVLVFMNVNAFLAVRSKNRMMNAVDEAAIAMAKHQGALLNELGRMNVRHLRSLILSDDAAEWGEEKVKEMRDLAFFGPLDAVMIANQVAANWGYSEGAGNGKVLDALRDHVSEIRNEYCANPTLYPEYREGQWDEYATRLGALVGGNMAVVPGFMETANAWSHEPLMSGAFYDAIAAKAWCWFSVGNRSRYFDMEHSTMPPPVFAEAQLQENSEVCPLHITFKSWMQSRWASEYIPGAGFSARWTNFVCRVSGCSEAEVAAAGSRLTSEDELWAFYDDNWKKWSTTFNPDNIPIAGTVKAEYDVAGCVASCLMVGAVQRIADEDGNGRANDMEVTAEAKPFGTVIDLDGNLAPVTAFNYFVAPSRPGERIFTEAQLVLMYSVPRSPGVSLSPAWYEHVKEHLPRYFESGPAGNGCYYCQQLDLWENAAFRGQARAWLNQNADSCQAKGGGPGPDRGGYDWAH